MEPTCAAWVALFCGLVGLLLIDLFVVHRGAREVSMRNAALSTAAFIAVGVAFGVLLGILEGHIVAGQFFAGYLLELSLLLDTSSCGR